MGVLRALTPTTIRPALPSEMVRVLELRARQERNFVNVDVPERANWLVVERNGIVRACGGFCYVGNHTVVVTDVYDDGTREGKRCLSALLDDAGRAKGNGVRVYVTLPLDRERLVRHLERRGMHVTGYSME